MLALAMAFGGSNVTFTQEKVQDTEVGATIVIRRTPGGGSKYGGTIQTAPASYLIDIAGKSSLDGTEGLHLGMTIPELEKLQSQTIQAQGIRQGWRGHGQRLGRRRVRRVARRLQGQCELSRRCEERQGCGERDRGGPRI